MHYKRMNIYNKNEEKKKHNLLRYRKQLNNIDNILLYRNEEYL